MKSKSHPQCFQVFVPNDTSCLTTWSVPTHIHNLDISFLVVDKGAFILRDKHVFIVGTGEVNRTTAKLVNQSNKFYFNFPTGCTYGWNNPSSPCRFNSTQLVDRIGAIATIQTLVYDTYLLLRVFATQRARVGVILTPHDSLDPSYFSSFAEHETAGYLVFPAGINLTCFEGVQFETRSFAAITSNSFSFNYRNTYTTLPAVYGMLVTQNSLTDSTAIRVFDRTLQKAKAITQEDQCVEEQVEHTTPERAAFFVFSTVPQGSGDCCFSNLCDPTHAPTVAPTVAPTLAPTRGDCNGAIHQILLIDLFGDGWQNVKLKVTVDGDKVTNYTMGCTNCTGMIEINTTECMMEIEMISDGPAITPWEARWVVVHENETYVGGWKSELSIIHNVVTARHMIYDDDSDDMYEHCHECPHPPPPAKKGPSGPGDSKGDDSKGKDDDADTNSTSAGSGPGGSGPGGAPGGSGGKAKAKPKPPAKVRIDIFDQQKDGKWRCHCCGWMRVVTLEAL